MAGGQIYLATIKEFLPQLALVRTEGLGPHHAGRESGQEAKHAHAKRGRPQ